MITTVVAWIYRAYHATLRLRLLLPDGSLVRPGMYPHDRKIFALCERDTLAVGGMVTGAGFTVLATIGRDGDKASALLEELGCTVVRGSSRQGGTAAFKRLLEALEASNGPAAIVVDGPLGPAGQAKGGAVACGLMTGRPVHGLAAAARHKVIFPRTWSGIYLPLPFTRVVVACDDQLPVPDPPDLDGVDVLAERLSRRLGDLREHASDML